MRISAKLALGASLAALGFAVPASAQDPSAVAAAQRAGLIGERYDGYLGLVTASPTADVRRQVAAVNLRRRNLYIGLGIRRQVAAQVVGIATGCELLERVGAGQFYMLEDGAWRRRAAGQAVPLPAHCGK